MKKNKVIILIILCLIFINLTNGIPWPIAPQNASHTINKTYGDWNGFKVHPDTTMGFHGGVDIPADSGTTVRAVIDGVVSFIRLGTESDSGFINIALDTLQSLAWHYGHIHPDTALRRGDSVHIGDSLGCVARFQAFNNDHLHFQRSNNDYSELTGYLNPLDSLSPSPSQVSYIDERLGTPHHPWKIYYVKDKLESITNSYETTYLRDSVDIIVKAHTDVELNPCCGVYAIGYGVEPLTTGGSIPFRKMFEMRDTIKISDSLKYYITYADTGADTLSRHFNNWYIVTNCGSGFPQSGYGLSNIQENCWPTKINIAGTGNADSIEDARFPDGYYITTIKVWAHSGDSAIAVDTVLVDNFNPKVKETYPTNWYHWIARDEKEVWCVFSESMDTINLNTTNIKIRSLVDTTYYYPIKKITYIDSLYKLMLEVDSFRFHDEVQVILNDSVTDLAGKSIEGSKGRGIASTWKFTVGVIKITDNDIMDIRPDIYGDKIAWVEVLSSTTSNIKFHDLTSHNTLMLNTTFDGFHNWPIVWNGRVAWREEVSAGDRIFYWDGNSTQLIVAEDLFRNQYDFDSCGVVMYSTVRWDGWYPDTIWVQYYQPGTGLLSLDKYTVKDGFSRNVDVDGSMIVWEHGKTTSLGRDFNPSGFGGNTSLWFERGFKNARKNIGFLHQDNRAVYTKDIYLRGDFGVLNLTSFMDSSINAMPSVSQGQSAWMRYTWNRDTLTIAVWVYDGAGGRQLSVLPYIDYGIYWPEIQNGDVLWHDYYSGSGLQRLHYYDGWQDNILVSGYSTTDFVVWSWQVENNQAVWLQLGAVYYPVYYDGQQITKLLERSTDSYRIGMHQGLVVYDAWDGHDNEIYLYIGDTLKTPPAIVKNLQGEMLGGKLPGKKVKLTWRQNTEADLAGYKIYRSNISYQYSTTPYATILAPETTFIDTLPLEGMNYYVATAYDNLNNESGFSNQTSVFIDNIPPSVPTNLVASYDSITQRVSLIWRSSPDGDLKLYRIYRSEITGNYTNPIDSVFKPDTTFIDSTIYLGKTYYYVVSAVDTNKNESGFSNEDTVVVPLFIASDFALATAYNNGRKIVSSPTGDKVHLVYSSGGGIYYCYSQDSGKSFSSSELVGSPGEYPALAIDTSGDPCVSWVSGSYIYYTHWTASWAPPETIVLPVVNVSPPSMVCDTTDTVHLVFVQYYWLPSDTGDLIYIKFHKGHFQDAIIETLYTHIWARTPSLVIDNSRILHLLWQGERSICYQEKDSTGWSGIDTIYRTTTSERLYPVIDLYGNKIMTVWQDRDSLGNLEIYSRQKTEIGWQNVKKVATTIGESKFPTLSGGHYCLWLDNTSGNWEVYMSQYVDTSGSWTSPENISNTTTASVFPHSAYSLVNANNAKLYCLWTEGDTIPYTIKFKKLNVSPVAKVFVDLGQAVQSQYCLRRDGYWVFGDKPYQTTDWGYENLRYKFTGLDPEKVYRMDLAYYFENQVSKGDLGQIKAIGGNSGQIKAIEGNFGQLEAKGELGVIKGYDGLSGNNGLEVPAPTSREPRTVNRETENCSGAIHRTDGMLKQVQHDRYKNDVSIPEDERGIGRIIQALVVDGIGLDTTFITPNHLKRISVWLPQNTYTDGEIIIDISKVKGKRVVCSAIGLYEFPVEKSMVQKFFGPQGAETQLAKPFYFDRIYPNPTNGMIRLRFNSPDERKISIKIYDVCGRLMHKEDILKSRIGMNEVWTKPEGLSAGVYFVCLEAEGYEKIEKVVLLR
ncbi:MAG: T9SS type A sorting domain-containing protein [candidate division WOR-3 bacterium]